MSDQYGQCMLVSRVLWRLIQWQMEGKKLFLESPWKYKGRKSEECWKEKESLVVWISGIWYNPRCLGGSSRRIPWGQEFRVSMGSKANSVSEFKEEGMLVGRTGRRNNTHWVSDSDIDDDLWVRKSAVQLTVDLREELKRPCLCWHFSDVTTDACTTENNP